MNFLVKYQENLGDGNLFSLILAQLLTPSRILWPQKPSSTSSDSSDDGSS